jgi:hypothetical protein
MLLLVVAFRLHGQGTFMYDQQSASNGLALTGYSLTQGQPLGQAFTPTLSSVGFVALELENSPTRTNATIYINLWADSIGGTLLGSTAPVFFPANFVVGPTNFFFGTPVAVTPGTQYYLQPVIQSGGNNLWTIQADFYGYPGAFYLKGVPQANGINAWFREGILVPEPSPALLILAGAGLLACAHRAQTKKMREAPRSGPRTS